VAFRSYFTSLNVVGDAVGDFKGAWKKIKAHHPSLAKDPSIIESFISLKNNPLFSEMGLTEDIIAQISGTVGLGYKEILDNLDNLGKKAAEKGIELEDFSKVVSDMIEGGGKVDGANWITKYIGDKADDFAGKKLKFEEYNRSEFGGRYVDVTDITDDGFKIFYEFKSVSKVPPGHFQAQFMKDLSAAFDLDQIKWIFNPSKNPVGDAGKTFREAMLSEIDKLPLTDDLARKLLPDISSPTVNKLRQEIIDQFDEIFELAN